MLKDFEAAMFKVSYRENGSLDFNTLVNEVSQLTRFGLATYIVFYDA